jgi:hypothetical protein
MHAFVSNEHYSPTRAITYVRLSDGSTAQFPYDPSDPNSVGDRLRQFAAFSITRGIVSAEVHGELVQTR